MGLQPNIPSVLEFRPKFSARPEALFFETSLVGLVFDTTREIPKSQQGDGLPFVLRVAHCNNSLLMSDMRHKYRMVVAKSRLRSKPLNAL
jgi:hypothetical protein